MYYFERQVHKDAKTVAKTLEECRKQRDEWLSKKQELLISEYQRNIALKELITHTGNCDLIMISILLMEKVIIKLRFQRNAKKASFHK